MISLGNRFLDQHPTVDAVYGFIPVLGTIRGWDKVMQGNTSEILPSLISTGADLLSAGFARPILQTANKARKYSNFYKQAVRSGMYDDKYLKTVKQATKQLKNKVKNDLITDKIATFTPQVGDFFINLNYMLDEYVNKQ